MNPLQRQAYTLHISRFSPSKSSDVALFRFESFVSEFSTNYMKIASVQKPQLCWIGLSTCYVQALYLEDKVTHK
jgi:hypothetical protein